MTDVVICAEGLGKRYIIGCEVKRERYTALRDVIPRYMSGLSRSASDLFRKRTKVLDDKSREFWALKDINFEVKRGEVLGIIGRNGAGKSTLLKILSRITEPSQGRVELKGRIASLLEVGTGFHPELTGRENVYLNGAILGMTRAEIRRRFDEIVAFSEVEQFLDTPVKRYSSGMYVRLAFAVAAHLEPEVLIVDEVLAVGDTEFQKKCLGKMNEVSRLGRTVLFVSHDMRRVTTLCKRGILLNAGALECHDDIAQVADKYLRDRAGVKSNSDLTKRNDHSGSQDAQFESIELSNDGTPSHTFDVGAPFTQRIRVRVNKSISKVTLHANILTSDRVAVHEFYSPDDCARRIAEPGIYTVSIDIHNLRLYPGLYSIDLWMGDRLSWRLDYITDAISFNVIQRSDSGISYFMDRTYGLVYQPAHWHLVEGVTST